MAWLDAIFLAFAALIAVLVRCYLERSTDTDRVVNRSKTLDGTTLLGGS